MSQEIQIYQSPELGALVQNFQQQYLVKPREEDQKKDTPKQLDLRGHQLLQKILLAVGYETVLEGKLAQKEESFSGWKRGTLYARVQPQGSIDVLVEGDLSKVSLGQEGDYTYLQLQGPAEYASFLRKYNELRPGTTAGEALKAYGLGIGGGLGIGTGMAIGAYHLTPLLVIFGAMAGVIVTTFTGAIAHFYLEDRVTNPHWRLNQAFSHHYLLESNEKVLSRALGLPVPEEEKKVE